MGAAQSNDGGSTSVDRTITLRDDQASDGPPARKRPRISSPSLCPPEAFPSRIAGLLPSTSSSTSQGLGLSALGTLGGLSSSQCSSADVPSLPDESLAESSSTTKKKRSLTRRILSASTGRLHMPTGDFFTMGTLYRKLSGSIGNLAAKQQRANRKRKHRRSIEEANLNTNYGSDYSIGKTSWPTPASASIFLPEFPNRSPINESNFSILGTIATGAFACVYRICIKGQPDYTFAMKTQNKSKVIARNAVRQIKDEVEIHVRREMMGEGRAYICGERDAVWILLHGYGASNNSMLARVLCTSLLQDIGTSARELSDCLFVATLYATWQSRNQLYAVLQYADGYGDLFQLWRDYGSFNEATIAVYGAEIALALDYLHSRDIVYRDLKLENVVLDLDGHIQLVDFGFAKRLAGDDQRTRTICGTLPYMAPEIARGLPYDKAVDWWSFGVLLHVLFTNQYPMPTANVERHDQLDFSELAISAHPSLSIYDLLTKLLCIEPHRRLQSLDAIKMHEFFTEINFDDAEQLKLHPFAHIERLQRCASCNSRLDRSASEISATSELESTNAFDEHYEFGEFDYFNDEFV